MLVYAISINNIEDFYTWLLEQSTYTWHTFSLDVFVERDVVLNNYTKFNIIVGRYHNSNKCIAFITNIEIATHIMLQFGFDSDMVYL